VPVIHQHDVVGGERELIAAARGGAVDRAQIGLPRIARGILDRQPGLVGELAEIHLVAVARLAQHADVGAGAEDILLAGLEHHRPHLRVLEAQPLHRVGELDVDREVIGIELELIVRTEPARGVHVHDEKGDLAIHLDPPMAVTAGIGLHVDGCHWRTSSCIIMHV
jgi:hypothetical protein